MITIYELRYIFRYAIIHLLRYKLFAQDCLQKYAMGMMIDMSFTVAFFRFTVAVMFVVSTLFPQLGELYSKAKLKSELALGYYESHYIVSPLTDITINGISVDEYAIVTPDLTEGTLFGDAVQTLSDGLHRACGKHLKISQDNAPKAFIIGEILDGAGADEFRLAVSEGNITVTGGANVGISRGITAFINEVLMNSTGIFELNNGYEFIKTYTDYATYETFGAVGDGKTDDFDAIIQTHEYANLNGLTVLARESANYYIGGEDKTAVIMTDTDWSTARFIIDDRNVVSRGSWVFCVSPSAEAVNLTENISELHKSDANLGTTLENDSLVVLTDSNVKRYIRHGDNKNAGSDQTDVLFVEKNGDISPDTPLIWDFETITSAVAYPVDTKPVTINGGRFTTFANGEESKYNYYARGLLIRRSGTVIDGLIHTIEKEGETGAPYAGFINISSCANVEVKNCTFTGHKTYVTIGSAGTAVSMGSYDINITTAHNVKFLNCNQTNDITNIKYWGIAGSNYCKNLVYDGCAFSRFDAHQGVVNATIRNSVLGHHGIQLIGFGTALIENTTVLALNFVSLRKDYGSTWNGEMIIRNCKFYPLEISRTIIGCENPENHDFGYTCYLPERIEIDGLTVCRGGYIYLFSKVNSKHNSPSYTPEYPIILPQEITVKNFNSLPCGKLLVSKNKKMFEGVEIEFID